MSWIKVEPEKLIDRGYYIVCTDRGEAIMMKYTWNNHAKTERGRMPHWEWQGRVSPWVITHYIPLPRPPVPRG